MSASRIDCGNAASEHAVDLATAPCIRGFRKEEFNYIHVYSRCSGKQLPGVIFCQQQESTVNLVVCCKLVQK